jgi:ribonucleotide monophosphatase NagD (HAD superfamily)
MIRAVLLDLAGVVYQGDEALPGAVDAVAALRKGGFSLRFLTNTTRMPRRALLSRLNAMGVEIAAEELFTPAQAAYAWLVAKGFSPHLLTHPALREDFAGVVGTAGEAVVVGDAADGFTYAALNQAFRTLMEGAAFVALARTAASRTRTANSASIPAPSLRRLSMRHSARQSCSASPLRIFSAPRSRAFPAVPKTR